MTSSSLIRNDTRVKVTVRRTGKPDYTDEAIAARALYDGCTGLVCGYHTGHGPCYGVKFEDDVVAYFDPDELEIQSSETNRKSALASLVRRQLLYYLKEGLNGDELLLKEVWEECATDLDVMWAKDELEEIIEWIRVRDRHGAS